MISEAAVLARYSHWPAEARPRTRAPSPSLNRLRRATSATAVEPAICAVFLNKRKASLPAFMRAGGSIYFRWSSLAFANLLRVKRHSKSHPGIDGGHMVTFPFLCPYRYGSMSRIDVDLYVRKESRVFSAAR